MHGFLLSKKSRVSAKYYWNWPILILIIAWTSVSLPEYWKLSTLKSFKHQQCKKVKLLQDSMVSFFMCQVIRKIRNYICRNNQFFHWKHVLFDESLAYKIIFLHFVPFNHWINIRNLKMKILFQTSYEHAGLVKVWQPCKIVKLTFFGFWPGCVNIWRLW